MTQTELTDFGGELVTDGGVETTREAEEITELSAGDQIIVDGQSETFTVLKTFRDPTGSSIIGVKAIDTDGNEYELRVVNAAGKFIDVRPEDDNAPLRATNGQHRADDFAVVGHDIDRVKQYCRDRWAA